MVGLVLVVAGGWMFTRSGVARLRGSLLVVAGVSWLASVYSVGAASTLLVHRPLLAAAVLAPAIVNGSRSQLGFVGSTLVVLTIDSVVAQWTTARWTTFAIWAIVIVATALVVRPVPWGALIAQIVAAGTASVAHLVTSLTANDRRTLYDLAVLAVAVALLVDRRRPADEVIETGLGGAGLLMGFRGPGEGEYRDAAGAPFAAPLGSRSIAVRSADFGEAVLVHNDPAFDDPAVHAEVSAAMALLARNVGLVRQVERQAVAVDESRRRLTDAERRAAEMMGSEVARDVLPHLRAIADTLGNDDNLARELLAEVDAEVRALSSGLALEAIGGDLPLALTRLAAACPLPTKVTVESGGGEGWDPDRTLSAYMLVSEALANAVKHSRATHVQVLVEPEAVTVTDDGVGGAIEVAGGGLVGARKRVARLGGELIVATRPGGGTVVTARLPA
jgi:signal transduction histidine kinase